MPGRRTNTAVEEAARDLRRGDAIALEQAPPRPMDAEQAEAVEATQELHRAERARQLTPATDPDHAEKQRAYREWMASLGPAEDEEKVDVVIEPTPETEQQVGGAEEREAEALLAWEADYAAAVASTEAAGVPIYVVGNRPPRPKWHGRPLPLGGVVPGAHLFTRIESWVSTGVLVRRG